MLPSPGKVACGVEIERDTGLGRGVGNRDHGAVTDATDLA
jgi:hypothetical protein